MIKEYNPETCITAGEIRELGVDRFTGLCMGAENSYEADSFYGGRKQQYSYHNY